MKSSTPTKKRRVFLHTRIVAIISIVLPLFVLGWIGVLELMQRSLQKNMREELTFTLILNKEMSESSIDKLTDSLKNEPSVKDVRYISPAAAAEELKSELGEDPVQVLGYNPLLPSIEVNLKSSYATSDSLPKVDSLIRSYHGVDNFSYKGEIISGLDNGIKRISQVLLIVMALMLLIAIIQISNTTHLAIYSKRFLIRSMTLLGAKYGLICRPFITYSVFNGLWGGILADIFVAGSLVGAQYYLSFDMMSYLSIMNLIILAVSLPVLGMLLSLITSSISTRRYIRMDGSKIVLS